MTGAAKTIVVKVGTSSITHNGGALDEGAIDKLVAGIAGLRAEGHRVLLVSSAAIAAGMDHLDVSQRPRDFKTLQALSAVGQIQLMRTYDTICAQHAMKCGQVLLAPPDFFDRARYLRARSCLEQQLELDVLPIINENDAVADDAIRFGDNDRIAALVAHLVGADLLILLTDTEGLLTADPNIDSSASLIEEIIEIDHELEAMAGESATTMSQGGMASKLSAAKIASWSGVKAAIAGAHRPNVLADVVAGAPGAGTFVRARNQRLGARKLWIAFALASQGSITVDAGAKQAVMDRGRSLLPVGATATQGEFELGDAVEVLGPDGVPFAKGLVRMGHDILTSVLGSQTGDLPDGLAPEAIHRDDLVVLPS